MNKQRQWRMGWVQVNRGCGITKEDCLNSKHFLNADIVKQELGLNLTICECVIDGWDCSKIENPIEVSKLLGQARELSEEVDVLILGFGLEDTEELIRESVRIPVICEVKLPFIVAQIYGTKIGVIKTFEDFPTIDRTSVEVIVLLKPDVLEHEIKRLEEQFGVPVIDSVRATLLLADLAAKNHYGMKLRHHEKGGRLFC